MDRIFEEKRFLRGTLYVDSVMSRMRQRLTFQFGKLGGTPQTVTLSLVQVPGVYTTLAKALEDSDVLEATSIGETAIPIWALKPIVRRLAMTQLIIERDHLVEQANLNEAREKRQAALFSELEASLAETEQSVHALKEDRSRSTAELATLQGKFDALVRERNNLDEALSDLNSKLSTSRSTLSSKEAQLANQEDALSELGETLKSERNTQEAQQETVEEQESQLKTILTNVGDLQRRVNEHGGVVAEKDTRISELISALQEVIMAARSASNTLAAGTPVPNSMGRGLVK